MNRFAPYALLFALCGALFFWRLGATPIMGLDEGLYAECSREMLVTGNYVVPRVSGEAFYDKPPICYWMQAAAMRTFGVNSFSARLPSAICSLLLVGFTVFLGSKLFGKRAGLLAGFALASCALTTGLARMAILDQAFALAITCSLGGFLLSYTRKVSRWGYLLFWIFMGLAAMVKGPAGVVLIGAIIVIFLMIQKDRDAMRKAMPVVGILLFAAITLPWYIMVHNQTGGAFTQEFFIHQNLQRAAGQDFQHNMPFWYYLPVFLAGFFPWSVFIPVAWNNCLRGRMRDKGNSAAAFAAIWAAAVLVIFSVSRSKLPSYIFPAYPAAALLIGLAWSKAIDSTDWKPFRPYITTALIISMVIAVALELGQRFLPEPIPGLSQAILPMSLSLALGAIAALVMITKGRFTGAFAALCCGMSGFLLAAMVLGLPIAARTLADPLVDVAAIVRQNSTRSQKVIAYGLSYSEPPTLAFYSGQPVQFTKSAQELTKFASSSEGCLVITHENWLRKCALPSGGKLADRVGPFCVYRFDKSGAE